METTTKAGIILTLSMILLIIVDITFGIISDYKYKRDFSSYWNLADKSSTIPAKAEYIDKFVNALQSGGFEGKYNAIILPTPNKGFDQNFGALKTLQQRLHEIEKMDIKSFEYQTAIQQITSQEQGEALEMLSIFKGIWRKENYILLWDWIGATQISVASLLLILGIVLWCYEDF